MPRALTLSLSLVLMGTGVSQGALVLVLDTHNKTVALVGSDTGSSSLNPEDGVTGIVTWKLENLGYSGEGVAEDSTASTYTVAANTIPLTTPAPGVDFSLKSLDNGEVIRLRLILNQPSINDETLTITGVGTPLSYASFTPGAAARLQSLAGQQLPRFTGPGFSDINVVAVPESSNLLLLGNFALAGFLLRRARPRLET